MLGARARAWVASPWTNLTFDPSPHRLRAAARRRASLSIPEEVSSPVTGAAASGRARGVKRAGGSDIQVGSAAGVTTQDSC